MLLSDLSYMATCEFFTEVPSNVDLIEKLINKFVLVCKTLFGNTFFAKNEHEFVHIPSDLRRFGNLIYVSCCAAESMYGYFLVPGPIKPGKELASIARNVNDFSLPYTKYRLNNIRRVQFIKRHYDGLTCGFNKEPFEQYLFYKSPQLKIRGDKFWDGLVMLDSGEIGQIKNIIKGLKTNEVYIVFNKCKRIQPLLFSKTKINLGEFRCFGFSKHLKLANINEIKLKYFCWPMDIEQPELDFLIKPIAHYYTWKRPLPCDFRNNYTE